MTVLTVVRTDSCSPAGADNPSPRQRVRLTSSRIGTCTVIALDGEVDASNADDMAARLTTHLGDSKQLLLDLSGLDFIAVQAFSVLHDIDLHCARRGISWVMVPSKAVALVLRMCDATGTLPVAPTTDAAHDILRRPRRHLTSL